MRAIWGVAAALALAETASAASVLDRVESPVYETPGTQAELVRKAVTCIGQLSTPVNGAAPGVVSADPQSGVVVANSAVRRATMFPYVIRSTLTFEAHDGRFRVTHTNIELRTETVPGANWAPAFRDKKNSLGQFILEFDDRLAACVKAPPASW